MSQMGRVFWLSEPYDADNINIIIICRYRLIWTDSVRYNIINEVRSADKSRFRNRMYRFSYNNDRTSSACDRLYYFFIIVLVLADSHHSQFAIQEQDVSYEAPYCT